MEEYLAKQRRTLADIGAELEDIKAKRAESEAELTLIQERIKKINALDEEILQIEAKIEAEKSGLNPRDPFHVIGALLLFFFCSFIGLSIAAYHLMNMGMF